MYMKEIYKLKAIKQPLDLLKLCKLDTCFIINFSSIFNYSNTKNNTTLDRYYSNYKSMVQTTADQLDIAKDKQQEKLVVMLPLKFKLFTLIISFTLFFLIILLVPVSQIKNQPECLRDSLFVQTQQLNNLLHTNTIFQKVFILNGQIFIDCFLIANFALFTLKFKNFIPLIWMFAFYATRGIYINAIKFPIPPDMYWKNQGIPSVGVQYEFARDFYYSGHTGFWVYTHRIWRDESKIVRKLVIFGAVSVVALLIIAQAHYTADVFGGWLFGSFFNYLSYRYLKVADKGISYVLYSISSCFKFIKNKICKIFSQD